MSDIKCFIIPVLTVATGIVTKVLRMSGSNARKKFNQNFAKEKLYWKHHKE
jgi:hypothetical protein